jgi:DNA-binding response OmpR family regulator
MFSMSKKILIVDDDKDLVLALGIRLKANGYNVVSAADGLSAVSMTRSETPDLVILDLGLPAGDGFSVLERMKGLERATPTIVRSARDPNGSKSRALAAGAVAYFQKPPNNHEFLSEVRQALGETVALSAFLSS